MLISCADTSSDQRGYSEKSEKNDRFRFILQSTFNMFDLVWIILVFVSTTLLIVAKLQVFSLAPCCQIYQVTEKA